jgi:hypothetical protein
MELQFVQRFWTGRALSWRRRWCLVAPIHQPGLLLFQYKNRLFQTFQFMVFEVKSGVCFSSKFLGWFQPPLCLHGVARSPHGQRARGAIHP